MSLLHDFLILDRDVDGEYELLRFIHDPRALHLHDDFVRYMSDTLGWIPSVNPALQSSQFGLCMHGPTIIELEGAATSGRVFTLWADLLSIGPPVIELTGAFTWIDNPELDGKYERLNVDRDKTVQVLRQLATWSGQVLLGNRRLYLFHLGI
ncbi:MAG: coagulation factor 5/8 type-like protein [Planctomycetaceae bacterium]|nr:coagulation factor 5/8 type-like protein [Planctomycetaceae bacterium]